MLANVGIAAVGCTASTAFRQADADRFTALGQLTPAVAESLEPTLPAPSRPTLLGSLSHNTLSVQQQPLTEPPLADRQHSASLGMPARSAAPRGRPAKEPKLSGLNPNPPPLPPPMFMNVSCPAVLLWSEFTHTQTHTHTRTRTRAHTHTHTHTDRQQDQHLKPSRGACSTTPTTTVARTDQPETM